MKAQYITIALIAAAILACHDASSQTAIVQYNQYEVAYRADTKDTEAMK